jgi:aminopeptidase N
MLKTDQAPVIELKNYQPLDFEITHIDLEVVIQDDFCTVESHLKIQRKNESAQKMILLGEQMELMEIKLNGVALSLTQYELTKEKLSIPVNLNHFEIKTKVKIHPKLNKALEGLYMSDGIYCTQNEPEGFRKITYYIDRPDNMAIFTTKIIADKKRYPQLLSNGNLIEAGELDNGRHFCTWNDPFPKPSYLYALVAGDLGKIEDYYTTKSGRKVHLVIYTDHGNEDKCHFAMDSLKHSMRWDEQRFGLEYDLDIYMIVAVDAFNMGAMENKGLNIFNSQYVLAKNETATDDDYNGVEAVIAHEYFHNWTGNRVTCRDWFQLTLKEGLTVFRDQEFSMDMTDPAVKRIHDVQVLRKNQFPEDQGAMAHPIRPASYIEINNFYTATVYEKGSEVIRMIQTIIGREQFNRGIKKYFELYDGMAVTTEEFIHAMEQASGQDLSQFRKWYEQVGTPRVRAKTSFDQSQSITTLTLEQHLRADRNDAHVILDIPFKIAAFDQNGKCVIEEQLLRINQKSQSFTFNTTAPVIFSLNRSFTAPVMVDYLQSQTELTTLFAHDNDSFNQWDAGQRLAEEQILHTQNFDFSANFIQAFGLCLKNTKLDYAYKAVCLSLPSESELNDKLTICDFDRIYANRKQLKRTLASTFRQDFLNMYRELVQKLTQTGLNRTQQYGLRSLKALCVDYLASVLDENIEQMLSQQFYQASNMTDELSALSALTFNSLNKQKYLQHFYQKWQHESLIMNKWFALQGSSASDNFEQELMQLSENKSFDWTNPNKLRSLWGAFGRNNLVKFHDVSGRGYQFMADIILRIDKYNPMVASRLATTFNRIDKLDSVRMQKLTGIIENMLKNELSKDSYEVLSKYIGRN